VVRERVAKNRLGFGTGKDCLLVEDFGHQVRLLRNETR